MATTKSPRKTVKKSAKARTAEQRRSESTSATTQAGQRPENPNDWLFLNPEGQCPDFVFGVLRRDFRSFQNSALEFGTAKLRPISAAPAWDGGQTTAYRHEVLLPGGADDALLDPFVLLQRFDAEALAWKQPLLVCLTLAFPLADRMHDDWECGRAFARREFCSRSMAAIIIQHAPFLVGSTNPPHLHILAPARRLKGTLGWADYVDELVKDSGQRTLFEAWEQFRSVWL
jgi:hypothetical protein